MHAVYDLVRQLGARRGLTNDAAVSDATGVARTTLGRWATDASRARRDALTRVEETFDLPAGTLAQVRDGHLAVEEVLERWDREHGREPSTSLLAGSASTSIWEQLGAEAQDVVTQSAHEAASALEELVVEQLRRRGVEPRFPRRRPGVQWRPDLEFEVNGQVHLVEIQGAPGGRLRVREYTSAIGGLLLAGRAAEDLGGLWLVVSDPLDPDEARAAEDLGVSVLHPGDWTPLDQVASEE